MLIPILSNTLAEGTKNQYRRIVKINIIINAGITSLLAIVICLFSSVILRFYGAEFTDKIVFAVLILSTIPSAICAVLGQIIASKGKMWAGFTLNFIWAILLVSFSIIFVGKMNFGALGLALAVLCAYILHSLFAYLYMRSKGNNNAEYLE
jgi:O-antigen/teichoic acid export membrane protein